MYKPAKMWMASAQSPLAFTWDQMSWISMDHTCAQRRGQDAGVPVLPLH